jgi:hypothetical protein
MMKSSHFLPTPYTTERIAVPKVEIRGTASKI